MLSSTENLNKVTAGPVPKIVAVGGFTSEVGKTTLLCDLLRAFPGWEAIKTTRGHYRSCGKDPHACCVSTLLEDKPVVRSGREFNYAPGKDTGRYWDAGAGNVHWVIATEEQVEEGIITALGRVQADGVFVEGNSFTKFIRPDYFVMVVRPDDLKIKATAKSALARVSAFYLSGQSRGNDTGALDAFLTKISGGTAATATPIFAPHQLPILIARIAEINPPLPRNAQANSGRMTAS